MKRVYKICIFVVLIDLLLYILLFHSGIILPFINKSAEEYSRSITSFPRDTGQKMIWILLHFPAPFLGELFQLNDKYLPLLIINDVWVILLFHRLMYPPKKKKEDKSD